MSDTTTQYGCEGQIYLMSVTMYEAFGIKVVQS